jgi:YD repeat-containing protein
VCEYNDLGELRRKTERNGLVHEYFYNAVGLLTRDEVAQSAANIDTAVSTRAFRYNTLGGLVLATSLAVCA